MNSAFRIEDAITAATKAALLAAKIKTNSTGAPEQFHPAIKKEDCLINSADYILLNKLSAEPLFYWKRIIEILNK